LTDSPLTKFAKILVDHSTRVKPGERVAVATNLSAEPLVRELFGLVLERGAYPHLLLDLAEQDKLLYAHASDDLLDFVPTFHKIAFEPFDVLFKIYAETDLRLLSDVDASRTARRQKALSTLLGAQMRRGASGALRWVSTMYPTPAYAAESGMSPEEYQDFVFRAAFADDGTPDPVAAWQKLQDDQSRTIKRLEGHDRVEIRGPNASLTLSIKGRKFVNACGRHNLPDGEIYTGPVENSVNGWVRFTYPAHYQGRLVQGVELTFKEGKVVKATAEKEQDLLLKMLDTDAGSRYVGEFAIGTNYRVNRFTKNILLDEKIGGSFHLAIGAGYPETGSSNSSIIHWDMICDLRQDSVILVDNELIYRNGQFVF
jgi:aminopeptidase